MNEDEASESKFILYAAHAVPVPAKTMARRLFFRGWKAPQIAEEIDVPQATIYTWINREKWDETPLAIKIKDGLEYRLLTLIDKDKKTNGDYKEIEELMKSAERTIRWDKFQEPEGHSGHLNPKIANRNKEPKKKPLKNFISEANKKILLEEIEKYLLEYQQEWVVAGKYRNRFILKSRQIGATNTFALESLKQALETGYNQIFISASRAQANIFRNYICQFVFLHCKIEIKGDPLILNIEGIDKQPELHFLGTNYRTAQGYSGDVYIDECCWIHDFSEIKKVASAMATLDCYRKTYFSTPSTIDNEAYAFFLGQDYNKGRAENERIKIDIESQEIKDGQIFNDDMFRQRVTIYDAIAKGNKLINIEKLKNEHSIDEFDNLFLCQPVDDAQSAFPSSLVRPCMVDSWEVWKDYKPYSYDQKYLGGCWLAIDPSHSAQGDPTAFMVVLPPNETRKKFRIIERRQFKGMAFEKMGLEVRDIIAKYKIDEIIIDKTGIGEAIFQIVQNFFPRVKGAVFNPISKSQMVFKAQSVFRKKRIEFDAGMTDVQSALLSIYATSTQSGNFTTYKSRRSAENGHGDLAWALLLALSLEPFDDENLQSRKARVKVFKK